MITGKAQTTIPQPARAGDDGSAHAIEVGPNLTDSPSTGSAVDDPFWIFQERDGTADIEAHATP